MFALLLYKKTPHVIKRKAEDADELSRLAKRPRLFGVDHGCAVHYPIKALLHATNNLRLTDEARVQPICNCRAVVNHGKLFLEERVKPQGFPQFSRLPAEIRLLIWRHTWDHRQVVLRRRFPYALHTGTRSPAHALVPMSTQPLEVKNVAIYCHQRRIRRQWGERDLFMMEKERQFMSFQPLTEIHSSVPPPVSLVVNRESREETKRCFPIAFSSPWIISRQVLFNYSMDWLVFPLHKPLSTAFSKDSCAKIVRLRIPELAPSMPDFTIQIGRFDDNKGNPDYLRARDRRVVADPEVRHPEFKHVWKLLRQFFPSLREIHVDLFYECQCYMAMKQSGVRHPLDLLLNRTRNFNTYCFSCLNVQQGIKRRFRNIGIMADNGGVADLARVLDLYHIDDPVYTQQTVVIGTAPAPAGRHKEEDVIVHFTAINNAIAECNQLDLYHRFLDWDQVRRQCIAKTLEHALGPPGERDTLVYEM